MPTDVANAAVPEAKGKPETVDPLYLKVRDLVYQVCGIYHSEEKLYLLVSACKRRLNQNPGQANSVREYLDLLMSPGSREAELRGLMNEITIGETSTQSWLRSPLSSHRVRQSIRCRARIPTMPHRVPVRARKGRKEFVLSAARPRGDDDC